VPVHGPASDRGELADLRAINRAAPRKELQAAVDDMVQVLLARPAWALAWAKLAVNKRVVQNLELTLDVSLAHEMITLQRAQSGEEKGVLSL
jgi:hypothetical protein